MLPDHEPVQVEENYYTSSIRTNSGSENLLRFKEKPYRRLIESLGVFLFSLAWFSERRPLNSAQAVDCASFGDVHEAGDSRTRFAIVFTCAQVFISCFCISVSLYILSNDNEGVDFSVPAM